MKVLVDTCVWSLVLRHKNPDRKIEMQLKELISDGRLSIIGPIRQELLSGITSDVQFASLHERMAFFEDIPLHPDYFVKAAQYSNVCRGKGIQGSHTDFLICAVAFYLKLMIFTVDLDFKNYRKHLPIVLFE